MMPATALPRVIILAALLVSISPSIMGAQQLLGNGDFGSGIDGWTLGSPVPATGADMSWDPSLGNPEPGSLELQGDPALGGSTEVEAWSPCFERDPEHLPRLEARVRRASSAGFGRCFATFIRDEGPGCTGARTHTGFTDPPPPIDVWQESIQEWGSPGGLDSYRVGLSLAYVQGTAICNFDSVSLTLEGIAAPTLGAFGMVALIVGVAAAALLVIPRLTR